MKSRFAPSPTGYLHIGGARTALFAWAWAKKQQGKFVLRIEDTDRERSTQASVDAILDGMKWLGLEHDEGPFYQTQRFERYGEIIKQLLNEDKAYYCECSKERLQVLRDELTAKGEKAKYDLIKNYIIIEDNVQLKKEGNVMVGQYLEMDLLTGVSKIKSEK